ncbi:hypothetical protein NL676_039840 [Syzygium grande]|nr:hypothetical protein NL676_039840 [Syzygium grande]
MGTRAKQRRRDHEKSGMTGCEQPPRRDEGETYNEKIAANQRGKRRWPQQDRAEEEEEVAAAIGTGTMRRGLESKTINKWKKALQSVSRIQGCELRNSKWATFLAAKSGDSSVALESAQSMPPLPSNSRNSGKVFDLETYATPSASHRVSKLDQVIEAQRLNAQCNYTVRHEHANGGWRMERRVCEEERS